jgi:hypothetical protein
MKQISEVEKKTFTSSLNICPEACCRKEGGGGADGVTPPQPLFPIWSVDISLKDDLPVIFLFGVSFVEET